MGPAKIVRIIGVGLAVAIAVIPGFWARHVGVIPGGVRAIDRCAALPGTTSAAHVFRGGRAVTEGPAREAEEHDELRNVHGVDFLERSVWAQSWRSGGGRPKIPSEPWIAR